MVRHRRVAWVLLIGIAILGLPTPVSAQVAVMNGGQATIEIPGYNTTTQGLWITDSNTSAPFQPRVQIFNSGSVGGAIRMYDLGNNQNVLVDGTGNITISGTLTASTKNFRISHPVEPRAKVLIHSALEGPEIGVYYRGEGRLVDGRAVVALPAYFEALTLKEGRTVHITAIDGWSPLYVEGMVAEGRFIVRSDGGNAAQRFYWEVKAVRSDVPVLVPEAPATP